MERRKFLEYGLGCGISSTTSGLARASDSVEAIPIKYPSGEFLAIADPHAHPNYIHGSRSFDSSMPTVEMMKNVGVTLCAFSAIGDRSRYPGRTGRPFSDTQNQLANVRHLEGRKAIRIALTVTDLQSPSGLAGLMAIEGGDALEGQLKNLDAFHEFGVRHMTLMHDHDNEIGFNQRSNNDGPLTSFGVRVVERMNELGMVVDVAHAKSDTMRHIAQICTRPFVDSHTSLLANGEDGPGLRRLRPWDEMEVIAKSGGVICTWPFAYVGHSSQRTTLAHWADEIVQMKTRLGIEHSGIDTDGGGGLPRMVAGWESIASVGSLIEAMAVAGLTQQEIVAVVGGNFMRVLRKCLP
jgi:microsomal dipeptidase-like Zn-dependent dipeptidase